MVLIGAVLSYPFYHSMVHTPCLCLTCYSVPAVPPSGYLFSLTFIFYGATLSPGVTVIFFSVYCNNSLQCIRLYCRQTHLCVQLYYYYYVNHFVMCLKNKLMRLIFIFWWPGTDYWVTVIIPIIGTHLYHVYMYNVQCILPCTHVHCIMCIHIVCAYVCIHVHVFAHVLHVHSFACVHVHVF